MNTTPSTTETRVAVLVDCDNVPPDILEHALRMVAQFGRVVLRRGYGNQGTLAHKWQEALVRLAFTACLQYQYAAGKNTADIALALDALEALFDRRADVFCLVTSDSDFANLCRKLRERGATVCIVGEPKSPDALRNASDQFFEWVRPEPPAEALPETTARVSAKVEPAKIEVTKQEPAKPAVKRRPRFVVEAVSLLAPYPLQPGFPGSGRAPDRYAKEELINKIASRTVQFRAVTSDISGIGRAPCTHMRELFRTPFIREDSTRFASVRFIVVMSKLPNSARRSEHIRAFTAPIATAPRT